MNSFSAGSYLVPIGFGMIVGAVLLYRELGWVTILMYGVIFYFLLVFLNGVDRGIHEKLGHETNERGVPSSAAADSLPHRVST